jgi:hypothetical protein
MNLKLPTSIVSSLILIITLAASAAAQQKRQAPARTQPQAAPTPLPTPPPTFDTLIATDTYRIYAEVRSVGQLISSNSVNEILEPILKLAGPPKEFRTIVNWLNTHADEVMTSRMLVTAWPAKSESPEAVIAIEFASPEEAAKFQQKLNPFLKTFLRDAAATPQDQSNKDEAQPRPPYHLQQAGSLILVSPTPVNLQKLRPAGSKWLSDDANFRVARNRLNTESIFIFFDVGALEKEEKEQERKAEEEYQKAAAERAANPQATEPPRIEVQTEPKEPEEIELLPEERPSTEEQKMLQAAASNQPSAPQQPSALQQLLDVAMSMAFMGAKSKWPDAVAVGLSLEGDSFDVRALLLNAPGTKSDAIPFLPMLAVGPPIVPEASSILPADTEAVVTMSLDLPQIYALFAEPLPMIETRRPSSINVEQVGAIESPFAALERQLNIKIKDDLLPLIGSEIVVSVPMTGLEMFQPPKGEPPASSSPSPSPSPIVVSPSSPSRDGEIVGVVQDVSSPGPPPVVIAIALKDKEGMRAFLPKLIEGLAFKGASALAQTERREDTELVSYANMMSYAFIGNFLVISPDVKATRHVVDSYLKRQTLAGEAHYKNYTRWQPRQVQGQIYISPSLMESYRTWIQQPSAQVDDQTRAFLTRFSVVAQPVTYSLSNEGFGPLHELHLPKNLVLLIIAATAGGINAPAPADLPSNSSPNQPQPPLPSRPANP